jgi:hypothetical protein
MGFFVFRDSLQAPSGFILIFVLGVAIVIIRRVSGIGMFRLEWGAGKILALLGLRFLFFAHNRRGGVIFWAVGPGSRLERLPGFGLVD